MMTTPLVIRETSKGEAICPYCGVGCRLLMESASGELSGRDGVGRHAAVAVTHQGRRPT